MKREYTETCCIFASLATKRLPDEVEKRRKG